MNEFVVELPIGLVAHGKIQPGLFVHNAFRVGKGEETGFSVVRAHAALAGPKISSCMTGSEKVTLSMTVGAIFSFSGRVEPPQTVLAGSMSFRIR